MSHSDRQPEERETGVSGLFSCWLWTRRLSHRGMKISPRFVGKKNDVMFKVSNGWIFGEYVGHPVAFLTRMVLFLHDQC